MSNQKGFSKVAIIIIVLILIGGAYFIFNKKDRSVSIQDVKNQNSQSNNSSADQLAMDNWKTYKNNKYGFEFKYPPSLKIGGNDDEIMASYGGHSVNFMIRIVPSQDFYALHPSWNKMLPRTIIVNQIKAKEYYNPAEESSIDDKRFVYVPLADQKQVEIFAEIGFDDASENFYKILSTFKFIK